MSAPPEQPDPIRVLILAAGGARRMGRPKQLIDFRGRSLLGRAVELARGTGHPVDVVLGAAADACRAELSQLDSGLDSGPDPRRPRPRILENPRWATGIASSIVLGVEAAPADCAALLIMLCDQPLIPAAHYRGLCAAWSDRDAPIVASAYGGTTGVPAIFGRRTFPDLLALRGDRGARAILVRERENVRALDCPEGLLDLDRPEDLERLKAEEILKEPPISDSPPS